MSIPIGIRKDKNGTASALFGVAAIQILIGGISYYLSSGEMGWLDRFIAFSGFFYIALAVMARWARLPAAVIGAVLYAAFLGFEASRSIELLKNRLLFKIPVVVLLIVAIVFALRRPPVSPGEEKV
jgi:ABC-type uncharacterized transport system permease subunit